MRKTWRRLVPSVHSQSSSAKSRKLPQRASPMMSMQTSRPPKASTAPAKAAGGPPASPKGPPRPGAGGPRPRRVPQVGDHHHGLAAAGADLLGDGAGAVTVEVD